VKKVLYCFDCQVEEVVRADRKDCPFCGGDNVEQRFGRIKPYVNKSIENTLFFLVFLMVVGVPALTLDIIIKLIRG
jgi:hypothetical protein